MSSTDRWLNILSILGPGGTMNGTINETVKQEMLDEFNRQMTKYSLYYVYIGASVFVASFVQVRRMFACNLDWPLTRQSQLKSSAFLVC